VLCKVKSKAVPLQAWSGPEGSRQLTFPDYNSEVRHPGCVGSVTKNILCITHTVEHNYISPSSTVGTQQHVSGLYVGHLQVMI